MFYKNKEHFVIFINYIINCFKQKDVLIQLAYIFIKIARVMFLMNTFE